MADGEWQRVHEAAGAPVVVGAVALELPDFLLVGTGGRQTRRIAREALGLSVHQIGLVPILGGQQFEVEPGLPHQRIGQGLVEVNVNPEGRTLGAHHEPGVEIVVGIAQAYLDRACVRIHRAGGGLRDEIPLLGGIAQADGAALDGAHAVVDHLDAGILLVVEATREGVAVNQDIHALTLEILQFIQTEVARRTGTGCQKEQRKKEQNGFSHNMVFYGIQGFSKC